MRENRHEHICESLDLLARDVLPEFAERAAERDQRKADELAPHVEKALARKKSMAPLADADIPVVKAPLRDRSSIHDRDSAHRLGRAQCGSKRPTPMKATACAVCSA